MIIHFIRVLLVVAVWYCCCLPTAFANPNNTDPQAALDAYGGGTGAELHAEAAALYASAVQETIKQIEAATSGRGARLSGQAIGKTRSELLKIQRLGPQIEIYGLPSGSDFSFRYMDAGLAQWNKVVKPYAAAPSSQKFVASIRLAIQKQTPARMKTLERLQKLVAEQKWQVAEAELYKLFDGLEVGICFLSDQERLEVQKPFSEVRSAIDTAMRRLRSQEAAQLLGQSRSEQLPDFQSRTNQIREASAAIAAAGRATWNDEQVNGPQLVEKIGDLWTEIHVACLRCRAFDWAMQPLFQMAGANATKISPDPTSQALQQDYAQFSTTAVQSIVSILQADAGRVSGDEAASLYVEYLTAVAPLARLVRDDNVAKSWDDALKQLAARSPALEAEVIAYEDATEDILRWRARTAASLANARSSDFQTLDKRMYDATVSKTPFLGLFPERPDGQAAPRLLASAPAILTKATPSLLGTKATAHDVVRVTPTSSSAIARYRARTYANVPAGLDVSEQVSALKSDLMIGDQAPPLTLATATSIHSAERGDLASVGGEIVGHHLEGLITRFAALPAAASILVPLGKLPSENLDQPLVEQMLMRFDMKPLWVHHDHFFVDLP